MCVHACMCVCMCLCMCVRQLTPQASPNVIHFWRKGHPPCNGQRAQQAVGKSERKVPVADSINPQVGKLMGKPPKDFNKLCIKFVTYVQFFEAWNPTNTIHTCSSTCLFYRKHCLNSTGNTDRSWYFLSHATSAMRPPSPMPPLPVVLSWATKRANH